MARISRRSLIFAVVANAWSQEIPTFSTNARVVTLLATVRDREGLAVKNLTENDFVLLEDGMPQSIRYFSRESDLPLTIGLLVNTSRSQQGVLGKERSASRIFLDKILREDSDHAFIRKHYEETAGPQGAHPPD